MVSVCQKAFLGCEPSGLAPPTRADTLLIQDFAKNDRIILLRVILLISDALKRWILPLSGSLPRNFFKHFLDQVMKEMKKRLTVMVFFG